LWRYRRNRSSRAWDLYCKCWLRYRASFSIERKRKLCFF
jgi:hypothetical protein